MSYLFQDIEVVNKSNYVNSLFQASNEAELVYTKNLLAKKFVSHGEEVVNSKPKNAFIAASMVVALWSQHADFGQLFMAYLLDSCPYLIPKYHQTFCRHQTRLADKGRK